MFCWIKQKLLDGGDAGHTVEVMNPLPNNSLPNRAMVRNVEGLQRCKHSHLHDAMVNEEGEQA